MKQILTILFLTFCLQGTFAQAKISPANERISSISKKLEQEKSSLFAQLKGTNIGPTVFSGRVSAIRVNQESPKEFYVAYASGGLWYTNNNGASFESVFDQEMTIVIGDFDVNWKTGEIWIGTGEVNSSRSSYAGVGMYYSSDKGKTWDHRGLTDSHHIGKVIIHPDDSNTIFVAVLGHLYSKNQERGVFKSTDKGKNWSKVLYINDETGTVDLALDPTNPDVLYAACWQRSRSAWNFEEAGKSSGIYKSTDRGDQWSLIITPESGLPIGEGLGRIGMDVGIDENGESVIYALIDNYNRRPIDEESEDESLNKDALKTMSKTDFLKLDNADIEKFLRSNNFPKKHTAESIKEDIQKDKYQVQDLALYLTDANQQLFDTPVIGAELYKSTDQGKSWTKTHEDYLDGVYNSYGYYFGLVKMAPSNPNRVFIAGVPILLSDDGGKTWEDVNQENVHVDHHALWINPMDEDHIILGNDGGINISYDAGQHWFKCNSPSVGQFYYINVDNAEPYNVYGGTQDNGVWMGSNHYREGKGWHNSGKYPYESLLGGDGMQVQIDARQSNIVYTGYQFGHYFHINTDTGERNYITPKHDLGERPYRWNWQTPILLSPHNQDILYMGSNFLMRSMNQGESFEKISPDLTKGGKPGDVAFGTLTSISESPIQFGLIYTGSDDGQVYRTKDGGYQWDLLNKNLPADLWVSRVITSQHDKNTVYVSLNAYRNDDFNPYLYKSIDGGDNWISIAQGLPMESINVIKEDPHHPEILYVGTDGGIFISTDTGANFSAISTDLPNVAVHDLVIHKKAKDLLVATHGRSIYKHDLSLFYLAFAKKLDSLSVPEDLTIRANSNWGSKMINGKFKKSEHELAIFSPEQQTIKVILMTNDNQALNEWKVDLTKGFNYPTLSLHLGENKNEILQEYLKLDKPLKATDDGNHYIKPGEYQLMYETNQGPFSQKLTVK